MLVARRYGFCSRRVLRLPLVATLLSLGALRILPRLALGLLAALVQVVVRLTSHAVKSPFVVLVRLKRAGHRTRAFLNVRDERASGALGLRHGLELR
jgi:hypothetical protein